MSEPMPDHGETWEDFYQHRARRLAEIEVAYPSMEWWEREQARAEMGRIRYELGIAEGNIEGDTEEQSMASV